MQASAMACPPVAHAVATALQRTTRRTTVTGVGVAVIACLIADFAGGTVTAVDAVAAAGFATAVGAGIGIAFITIITALARIDSAIAADLEFAARRTAIEFGVIAVIAFFIAGLFGSQVTAMDAVAAGRQCAG